MKSSEARMLMETHLVDFFTLFPDDIPAGFPAQGSPIFRMGMDGGLSVESAARYVYWMLHTKRITDSEAGGLLAIVGDTARFLHEGSPGDSLTWEQVGVHWETIKQAVHAKQAQP